MAKHRFCNLEWPKMAKHPGANRRTPSQQEERKGIGTEETKEQEQEQEQHMIHKEQQEEGREESNERKIHTHKERDRERDVKALSILKYNHIH